MIDADEYFNAKFGIRNAKLREYLASVKVDAIFILRIDIENLKSIIEIYSLNYVAFKHINYIFSKIDEIINDSSNVLEFFGS